MRTYNGGSVAVATELDVKSTTHEQRQQIKEREALLKAWRRSLPRKRTPDSHKPGPVTWVQL